MARHSVSRKLAIIDDIKQEGNAIWSMLSKQASTTNNPNVKVRSEEDVKRLFIDILCKDKDGLPRFNLKECKDHIEKYHARDAAGNPVAQKMTHYNLLVNCHYAVTSEVMEVFLFSETF